ncbi:hypothetical protein BpHYR1_040861 [Brachionus plicatilis]|uniref:Uncharacterized protein n=1 Tax=Brachionus plicatilis TaxID=10195 RepID=A0A3M7PM89_BRAPC|nr:hypothetical protein BpHYR1_040861 [Brachionus plicatilis]
MTLKKIKYIIEIVIDINGGWLDCYIFYLFYIYYLLFTQIYFFGSVNLSREGIWYRELGILLNSELIQTREQKLIAKYVSYGSPNRLDRVGKGTDKQINNK